MARRRRSETGRPLGELFLAPRSRFPRYGWIVLVVAVALEALFLVLNHLAETTAHPLAPVGAGVVFVAVVAAGLSGTLVGLLAALAGVLIALPLLADFGSTGGTTNAIVSAVAWCVAAVITGLVVGNLRRQLVRRETALEQSLNRSLSARQQIERVLEFAPHFQQGENLGEVAQAVTAAAVATFGADGARIWAIEGRDLKLLAISPASEHVKPGLQATLDEFPDFESMLAYHRPSFVRDLRETRLTGAGRRIQHQLNIVSTVRIPIIGPGGAIGLLTLGWTHAIARPSEELLAIMQRFADQAAIAWQNALRAEAQQQADALYETLQRVVALAPSFHITGTREEVAQACCEAALVTFKCRLASLYRVEGDRLRVLGCAPPLQCIPLGQTFPLREDMPLVSEMRSHTPTFIPDVADPSRSLRPWPEEVVAQAGTRSALYVPLRFNERGPQNLLVLNWDEPRERPDENLLVIVERFADQVALALTNASAERLHARLEASLLPTAPIEHPFLRVTTRYRTGEQRLRLGGDFVGSILAADQGLDFVIGDVSGHGPDAAALGANLRSTWKALMLAGESIPKTVSVMRQVLVADRTEPNAFATIVAGHIDIVGRSLSLVNAGHLPPLLVAGTVESLSTDPTPPLGVEKDVLRPVSRFPLPERWSLFCYTDGLVDTRLSPDSSERYGEDRLIRHLGGWAGETPDGASLDVLMNEIEKGSGGHFADDVAVLLVTTKNGAVE